MNIISNLNAVKFIQRLVRILVVILILASIFWGQRNNVLAQSTSEEELFDFNFESGVHSIDLDADSISDILTIGYISGGTGYTQFDFNFLIERPITSSPQQRFFTVIPDSESRNNFVTLQNADCFLKSLMLVKIGENQDDWKLLILERTSVPEAGYTESTVEFRLLRLRTATTSGFPRYSYRQIGNEVSNDNYCNVDEAFDEEWGRISILLLQILGECPDFCVNARDTSKDEQLPVHQIQY